MAVRIHPHKGYLNTRFQVFVTGTESTIYRILKSSKDGETEIENGCISPNEPFSFKIPVAGDFRIEFSDGTDITLYIEDGYKLGGSRFKHAYISDECPWAFVVMYDRTYFYNRDLNTSYVEPISPDSIEYIAKDYVIFSNTKHSERTVYDLAEQKPLINISNVKFHNDSVIIWSEEDELVLYSLLRKELIGRIKPIQYVFNDDKSELLYAVPNMVYSVGMSDDNTTREIYEHKGMFLAFINASLSTYVTTDKEGCDIQIIKHSTGEILNELYFEGSVASINGVEIIDVQERIRAIRSFSLNNSEFPEASINSRYHELFFYPCEWDIFYTQETTDIVKTSKKCDCNSTIVLKSTNSNLNQELSDSDNKVVITESRFMLFNRYESFVRSKLYSAAGYHEGGKIMIHNGIIILIEENRVYTLSKNGYWDNPIERQYEYDRFEKYGVVFDKEKELYRSLKYNIKGKEISFSNNPIQHMILGDSAILLGGKVLFKRSDLKSFKETPTAISPNGKWGIEVNKYNDKIYLMCIENGYEVKSEILGDIYDTTHYENVLMSEDGTQILYRNSKKSEIRDIATGEIETFDNLSYIEQCNGIRPVFEQSPSSLQPRIINPITGQTLDCELMKKIHFISPDGRYYAGAIKDMYEEQYYIESGEVLGDVEFKILLTSFKYPGKTKSKDNNFEWDKVTNRRIDFVRRHIGYLHTNFSKLTHNSDDIKKWAKGLIDEDNTLGELTFIRRVIDVRGIALIKRMSDNSEAAKINLGKPLSYINYVSFSYDSKYVSIAGYRDFAYGLFLVYDLEGKKTLCRMNTHRAVWTTAFSANGSIAAYTSNPKTIYFDEDYHCQSENEFENHLISHRNFLTFSPNGSLMALSNQGYISKYDINGDERSEWGHQPSTFVEIREVDDVDKSIITFNDLSNLGIEDVSTAKSVASVAFSNDNKRFMMVGKDGVVIIRNLHLEDYATE